MWHKVYYAHTQTKSVHIKILKKSPFLYQLLLSVWIATASGQGFAIEWNMDIELAAGYSWDNNVGLDELERATGASDELKTLQAQASGSLQFAKDTSLRLTAGVIDDSYLIFKKADRTTKTLGLNLETELDIVNVGINWFSADSKLDGKQFLTYERFSPYISGFLSKRWFLRGEYVYGEKEIESRPGRDADIHSAAADSYVFIQGLKRYLVLGYAYRVDNSRANRYDYESHSIKIRYQQITKIRELPVKFELEAKLEDRKYKESDPFIKKTRKDTRARLTAQLTLSLTDRLSIALLAKNADYHSNLPTASYSDLIVGTELRFTY